MFREFDGEIIVGHNAPCGEERIGAAGGLGPGARPLIAYIYTKSHYIS